LIPVVVLYKCEVGRSKTIRSLVERFHEEPAAFADVRAVIYDNGPTAQQVAPDALPFSFEYVHDPSNKGLGAAYNHALSTAKKGSGDWLLLLDQDSLLPRDFIASLSRDIAAVQADESVVAVVPKIRHGPAFFSPSKVLFGGTYRPIDMTHRGVYHGKIFAIGSGAAVRASFLDGIGGFNEQFWMDSLDRWLFHTIETLGKKVFVSDSIIDHELSVMDFDNLLSPGRYANIMKYETLFMKSYKPRVENWVYYLRLLKRTVYLFFVARNKEYARMTFRHLLSIVSARAE
jgi:GT2 family glycosyltransferase